MKKIKCVILLFILVVVVGTAPCANAYADANTVYLGGIPAGFSLTTRGAYIVGLTDVITGKGIVSPSKDAGLCVGDSILSINGESVNSAEDVEKIVKSDNELTLDIKRCEENMSLQLTPAKDLSGNYKLGVFIRDGVNGIGTVTFVRGNRFASLGHPVTDENGKQIDIIGGKLFLCNVTGVIKGERGVPGELRGVFLKNKEIAQIEKNTIKGVYGTLENERVKDGLTKIEIDDGQVGNATIYTTINGKMPKEYGISIIKTSYGFDEIKNYVIRITDSELLEKTGGIVQGMSGSPIIQNGKLVGAVTHVFINDPTRGFGISIDNMIDN